ncbi:WbqC family protein [Citrobacter freundii]
MKVGIMQPYFFPYIGYFQLANAVDKFVIYDDIQFSKKGWIQRNRLLMNNQPTTFSIALKKDSDYLDIIQRELSDNFDRLKLCRQIQGSYRKAPYYDEIYKLVEDIILCEDNNLFQYIENSITKLFSILDIDVELVTSSTLALSRELKSQERVIHTCVALGADEYINPPGGVELYTESEFIKKGLKLKFLDPVIESYSQSNDSFISHLSIIDVMMWNGLEMTKQIARKNAFIQNS